MGNTTSGLSVGLEGMRLAHEEAGVASAWDQAHELRRRWLMTHSDLDQGGGLYVVHDVLGVARPDVVIVWRLLDSASFADREIIRTRLRYLSINTKSETWPEPLDCLIGYLVGDVLHVVADSTSMLKRFAVEDA